MTGSGLTTTRPRHPVMLLPVAWPATPPRPAAERSGGPLDELTRAVLAGSGRSAAPPRPLREPSGSGRSRPSRGSYDRRLQGLAGPGNPLALADQVGAS